MVRLSHRKSRDHNDLLMGSLSSIAPWTDIEGLVGYALGVRVVCATLQSLHVKLTLLFKGGSKSHFHILDHHVLNARSNFLMLSVANLACRFSYNFIIVAGVKTACRGCRRVSAHVTITAVS